MFWCSPGSVDESARDDNITISASNMLVRAFVTIYIRNSCQAMANVFLTMPLHLSVCSFGK